ncbi:DNA polymerase III PolC-type [compost metagenome]
MNYIILDLEATCWDGDRTRQNEIIEIGAQKVSNEFGELKIASEFAAFVKPKLNPVLSDFCKNLTSIKQEDVNVCPQFPIVFKQFREWIGTEPYVLCSWGKYDKNQFEKDCKLHHISTNWLKNHISLKHQYMDQFNVKGRDAGMSAALRKFGLKLDGTHHRGIDDAKNITKIFIKNFDNWEFPC